jgi:hypothetical protein
MALDRLPRTVVSDHLYPIASAARDNRELDHAGNEVPRADARHDCQVGRFLA